jgi:hypothetical protein
LANTLNLVEQQSGQIKMYLPRVNELMMQKPENQKKGKSFDFDPSRDVTEFHSGKSTPFPKVYISGRFFL